MIGRFCISSFAMGVMASFGAFFANPDRGPGMLFLLLVGSVVAVLCFPPPRTPPA